MASQAKERNLDLIGCAMGFKQERDIWKNPSECHVKNELNKKNEEKNKGKKKNKEQFLKN